ncbi:MAG: hypothetical protein M3Q59_01265 [Actinomycetota bacterium]|nr:hypothetical protein [Actinomycetota bacterium]
MQGAVKRELSWWIEWPAGAIRVGVVFLVVVAAVAAVVAYPGVIADLGDQASVNDGLSFSDREVAGGNGVVDDQRAVYEARARIPADATYHVAVSDEFEAESVLTVPYVSSYFEYFLMPRRPAEGAPWVICYGCDVTAYGEDATEVWTNGEGISILRVET